ncbi:hypothetical protein [Arthrobacter sp. RCC_34]|uniref:hypothetical protein n=1 Tax=Arthrobacter sp. RCC_34 TaxID=3239230 RepID=UPI0035254371
MTEYIAAITLPKDAVKDAYDKLIVDGKDLTISSLALVERKPGGKVEIVDHEDVDLSGKVAGGALIGLLAGVLGGPLGVLFGAGIGAAVPAVTSLAEVEQTEDALSGLNRLVAPGSGVILAYTKNESGALDEFVARLDGTIERHKVSDVIAELEAQKKAENAAKEAARKELWESRAKEWDADLGKRWEHLKAAFTGQEPAADEKKG